MRNLILSAFPRNMRLPDPFTPNLKVDMLPEISHAPRVLTNFASVITPMTFKKVSIKFLVKKKLLLKSVKTFENIKLKRDVLFEFKHLTLSSLYF